MHGDAWTIVFTKQAIKERDLAVQGGFRNKLKILTEILSRNPLEPYPPYEKLQGDLAGLYSRRINQQHRLVYQVLEDQRIVKIVSCWTHYTTV